MTVTVHRPRLPGPAAELVPVSQPGTGRAGHTVIRRPWDTVTGTGSAWAATRLQQRYRATGQHGASVPASDPPGRAGA